VSGRPIDEDIDMEQEQIERQVRQFIDREILSGQGSDLTASTSLFELGILDSFALFSVLGFIAAEFHVTLPLETVTREAFETTGAIARVIYEHLHSPSVSGH
jgi:acyl carrier protein